MQLLKLVLPIRLLYLQTLEKYYDISAGDEISWTNTEEGILLKIEKKVTEDDIMGMIKKIAL